MEPGIVKTRNQGKPEVQEALYVLSTCMTCGCCNEACPKSTTTPYSWAISHLTNPPVNSNPPGELQKPERLRAALDDDGIAAVEMPKTA